MIQIGRRAHGASGMKAPKDDHDLGARARAAQRRAVRQATRIGATSLVGVAAFDLLTLPLLHPSGTPVFIVANGLLGAAGLAAFAVLGRIRRRPELIAFLLALAPGLAALVVAVAVPEAALLMLAYLLLLPGAVALLVPWRTQTHVRWLAVYGIGSLLILVGPLANGLDRTAPRDEVLALLLAIAFSFLGHARILSSRLRYGAQLERGRALRRETVRQRVEIDRLYAELLHTAQIDPLTRAGNRLLLDRDLRSLASRLGRSGGTAWVLAIDVDQFKAVNDRFGHEAGDRALAAIAQAMRAELRASDILYRFGGDEFVVLLADASVADAGVLAERLRRAVAALPPIGPDAPLTISVGAAPIGSDELETRDGAWLRRADQALYEAKAGGRDRIRVAGHASRRAGGSTRTTPRPAFAAPGVRGPADRAALGAR